MNENVTMEVVNEEVKELPGNVLFTTAENGTIRLSAVNAACYYKEYYSSSKKPGVDQPYKAKTIKLPVSRDGIAFKHVDEYFKYLLEKCGYRKE